MDTANSARQADVKTIRHALLAGGFSEQEIEVIGRLIALVNAGEGATFSLNSPLSDEVARTILGKLSTPEDSPYNPILSRLRLALLGASERPPEGEAESGRGTRQMSIAPEQRVNALMEFYREKAIDFGDLAPHFFRQFDIDLSVLPPGGITEADQNHINACLLSLGYVSEDGQLEKVKLLEDTADFARKRNAGQDVSAHPIQHLMDAIKIAILHYYLYQMTSGEIQKTLNQTPLGIDKERVEAYSDAVAREVLDYSNRAGLGLPPEMSDAERYSSAVTAAIASALGVTSLQESEPNFYQRVVDAWMEMRQDKTSVLEASGELAPITMLDVVMNERRKELGGKTLDELRRETGIEDPNKLAELARQYESRGIRGSGFAKALAGMGASAPISQSALEALSKKYGGLGGVQRGFSTLGGAFPSGGSLLSESQRLALRSHPEAVSPALARAHKMFPGAGAFPFDKVQALGGRVHPRALAPALTQAYRMTPDGRVPINLASRVGKIGDQYFGTRDFFDPYKGRIFPGIKRSPIGLVQAGTAGALVRASRNLLPTALDAFKKSFDLHSATPGLNSIAAVKFPGAPSALDIGISPSVKGGAAKILRQAGLLNTAKGRRFLQKFAGAGVANLVPYATQAAELSRSRELLNVPRQLTDAEARRLLSAMSRKAVERPDIQALRDTLVGKPKAIQPRLSPLTRAALGGQLAKVPARAISAAAGKMDPSMLRRYKSMLRARSKVPTAQMLKGAAGKGTLPGRAMQAASRVRRAIPGAGTAIGAAVGGAEGGGLGLFVEGLINKVPGALNAWAGRIYQDQLAGLNAGVITAARVASFGHVRQANQIRNRIFAGGKVNHQAISQLARQVPSASTIRRYGASDPRIINARANLLDAASSAQSARRGTVWAKGIGFLVGTGMQIKYLYSSFESGRMGYMGASVFGLAQQVATLLGKTKVANVLGNMTSVLLNLEKLRDFFEHPRETADRFIKEKIRNKALDFGWKMVKAGWNKAVKPLLKLVWEGVKKGTSSLARKIVMWGVSKNIAGFNLLAQSLGWQAAGGVATASGTATAGTVTAGTAASAAAGTGGVAAAASAITPVGWIIIVLLVIAVICCCIVICAQSGMFGAFKMSSDSGGGRGALDLPYAQQHFLIIKDVSEMRKTTGPGQGENPGIVTGVDYTLTIQYDGQGDEDFYINTITDRLEGFEDSSVPITYSQVLENLGSTAPFKNTEFKMHRHSENVSTFAISGWETGSGDPGGTRTKFSADDPFTIKLGMSFDFNQGIDKLLEGTGSDQELCNTLEFEIGHGGETSTEYDIVCITPEGGVKEKKYCPFQAMKGNLECNQGPYNPGGSHCNPRPLNAIDVVLTEKSGLKREDMLLKAPVDGKIVYVDEEEKCTCGGVNYVNGDVISLEGNDGYRYVFVHSQVAAGIYEGMGPKFVSAGEILGTWETEGLNSASCCWTAPHEHLEVKKLPKPMLADEFIEANFKCGFGDCPCWGGSCGDCDDR